MIGFLNGTVIVKDDQSILIDVNGVGYKVYVSVDVISTAIIGQNVQVFIHTHVREDVLELYGFIDPADLKLFAYLISVSGVGCRTALGIFSVGSRNAIVQAISEGNVSFFTAVPRLGKKNGQKIIIELKNKIGAKGDLDLSDSITADDDDVISALKIFGFSPKESLQAIQAIEGEGKSVQEKIKLALKYLGK